MPNGRSLSTKVWYSLLFSGCLLSKKWHTQICTLWLLSLAYDNLGKHWPWAYVGTIQKFQLVLNEYKFFKNIFLSCASHVPSWLFTFLTNWAIKQGFSRWQLVSSFHVKQRHLLWRKNRSVFNNSMMAGIFKCFKDENFFLMLNNSIWCHEKIEMVWNFLLLHHDGGNFQIRHAHPFSNNYLHGEIFQLFPHFQLMVIELHLSSGIVHRVTDFPQTLITGCSYS